MEKKFSKEDREFKIFTAIWSVFQKYAIPEDNDQYWESYFAEMKKVIDSFNKDKLAIEFATVISNELERKYNAWKEKSN